MRANMIRLFSDITFHIRDRINVVPYSVWRDYYSLTYSMQDILNKDIGGRHM